MQTISSCIFFAAKALGFEQGLGEEAVERLDEGVLVTLSSSKDCKVSNKSRSSLKFFRRSCSSSCSSSVLPRHGTRDEGPPEVPATVAGRRWVTALGCWRRAWPTLEDPGVCRPASLKEPVVMPC